MALQNRFYFIAFENFQRGQESITDTFVQISYADIEHLSMEPNVIDLHLNEVISVYLTYVKIDLSLP